MTAKFIVADDFGISPKVNQAILKAVDRQEVNVVSILPNLAQKKHILMLLKQLPKDRVSFHFNITRGEPLSPPQKVKSLITKQGKFYALPTFLMRLLLGLIKVDEIMMEFRAQYQKLKKLGAPPKFLDSEQHIHTLSPLNRHIEKEATRLGITFIRSNHSTHSYLRRKKSRYILLHLTQTLLNLRFGRFSDFSHVYEADITHPGTNYDRSTWL